MTSEIRELLTRWRSIHRPSCICHACEDTDRMLASTPHATADPTREGELGCGMCGPDGNGLRCTRHANGMHQSMVVRCVESDEVAQEWPIAAPAEEAKGEEDVDECDCRAHGLERHVCRTSAGRSPSSGGEGTT